MKSKRISRWGNLQNYLKNPTGHFAVLVQAIEKAPSAPEDSPNHQDDTKTPDPGHKP